MRLRRGLVVAALLLAAQPPVAAQEAGAFQCRYVYNPSAGSGSTNCVGSGLNAPGVALGGYTIDIALVYNETLCPAMGTASGVILLDGDTFAFVDVTRLGAEVVAVLSGAHDGASIGEWVFDVDDFGVDFCSRTSVGVTVIGTLGAV